MSIKKHFRLSRGFTLVELLVVIAIIGILATLLLLQLGVARGKARDVKRIADVNQLRTTLEMYFDDNSGNYVAHNPIVIADITKYLTSNAVPKDPLSAGDYYYAFNTVGGKTIQYQIYAELEQRNVGALGSDSDINSNGWTGGITLDASVATTEACTAYVSGTSKQCVYDQGQR